MKPVIAFVREKPDGLKRLAAKLSNRLGRNVLPQQVYDWTREDASKRASPRLGMGLLMVSLVKEMNRKTEKPRAV